jgi:hypothetical protein
MCSRTGTQRPAGCTHRTLDSRIDTQVARSTHALARNWIYYARKDNKGVKFLNLTEKLKARKHVQYTSRVITNMNM